jgi:RNA polymerase sigma factor (sigma-70 family)
VSNLSKLRHWLLGRAQRLFHRSADAEDLVQDVIARYLRSFPEGESSPTEQQSMAWMATQLQNDFISRLRKERVQLRAEPDPALQEAIMPDPGDPPLSQTITDEQLALAMEGLSPKQREVFEASASGLRYAEIAKKLGIREGAVAKRIFDARKRIRSTLMTLRALELAGGAGGEPDPPRRTLTFIRTAFEPSAPERKPEPREQPFIFRRRTAERPAPQALLHRRTERAILVRSCSRSEPLGSIDSNTIALALARPSIVRQLPRHPVVTSRRAVQVLVDVSESMIPFAADCAQLSHALRRAVRVTQLLEFSGTPLRGVSAGGGLPWRPWRPPPAETTLIVISNLGLITPPLHFSESNLDDWIRFAERARRSQVRVVAFVPHDLRRVRRQLGRLVALVPWDRSTTISTVERALRGTARDR